MDKKQIWLIGQMRDEAENILNTLASLEDGDIEDTSLPLCDAEDLLKLASEFDSYSDSLEE